ncbi:hypothetical protein ABZP36_031411, partial [Zizania latifolia]
MAAASPIPARQQQETPQPHPAPRTPSPHPIPDHGEVERSEQNVSNSNQQQQQISLPLPSSSSTSHPVLMAAAIDMYKYSSSTHQIASSDQELMKALEPFIRSASSPYHYYSPSSSSMTQDSYMPTPSYSSSVTTSSLPPTATAATSSSFSQLPPLYSSQYASSAASAASGPMALTHLGPAQVRQIQAQFLVQQQQQRGLVGAFLGPRAQPMKQSGSPPRG